MRPWAPSSRARLEITPRQPVPGLCSSATSRQPPHIIRTILNTRSADCLKSDTPINTSIKAQVIVDIRLGVTNSDTRLLYTKRQWLFLEYNLDILLELLYKKKELDWYFANESVV